ncbi:MAG: serine hydrolase domain-containing protein [Candidatus Hodarchaeota archaeon]
MKRKQTIKQFTLFVFSLIIISLSICDLVIEHNAAELKGVNDDYWHYTTPESQGMDSTLLNSMIDQIHLKDYAIDSVIIIRNGYLIFEVYPNSYYNKDSLHFLYSCTKSVTSALIGIAIQEGFIDSITQKVIDFFPDRKIQNLDSRKKNMTLEHLLTMSAGIEWDEWTYWYWDPRNDFYQAIESTNMVQFILDRPMMNEPGTKWIYNSGASHLLSAIIQKTTGMSTLAFANKYLFEPLGVSTVNWGHDSLGVYFGGYDLYMRPRDVAKFGYLFLNNGTWDDKQIFSINWATQSSKIAFYPNDNSAYGFQWWIHPSKAYYYASGLFAQRIIIVPDYDLVVVFTAEIRSGSDPEIEMLNKYILAAVKENITVPGSHTTEYSSTSNLFKTTTIHHSSSPGFEIIVFITGLISLLLLLNKKQFS